MQDCCWEMYHTLLTQDICPLNFTCHSGLPSLVDMRLSDPSFLQLFLRFRALAVVVLLVRGALSVNIEALRRLRSVALQLGFIPFLTGAAVHSCFAIVILGMPVAWATMTG